VIVGPSASGTIGIDPVLVVAPALALIGGTVILLRLLPLAARAGDRLASRGNKLIASLACWEISRHPVRQASVALLVVVSVATSTLALSEHQSWLRSAHDQSAFTTGADVRVDTPAATTLGQSAAIATAPGVSHAMAVAPVSINSGEMLALDPGQAASTVLLRSDETTTAAPALFGKITPAGPAPGVALSGSPTALSVRLSLGPADLHLGSAQVSATVQDATGNLYPVTLGTLAADGRPHVLTARLAGAGGPVRVLGPVRLTGMTLNYQMPASKPKARAVLTVLSAGTPQRPVPGSAVGRWTPEVTSSELTSVQGEGGLGTTGRSGSPGQATWTAAGGAQVLSFAPGYGLASTGFVNQPGQPLFGQVDLLARGVGTAPLPAIATQAFLSGTSTSVGAHIQVSVNGVTVLVHIVAAVGAFPTVTESGGGLIMALGSLEDVLADKAGATLPVTQWWLATTGTGVPPGLSRHLPGGSAVTSTSAVGTGLTSNALSAVPQQALLAMAVAAALLAIAGFCVAIAANIRQRRPQTALLSALGVPRRAQAGQFCLEELMISVPAAVVGLLLGGLMSALLVPAVTLTSAATSPVPPPLTVFSWSLAVPLALAVAVLPVLVAAASAVRQPDAAARLRITEAV
jgi:hypothetical protein